MGCGGRVGGWLFSGIAFKARLMALESLGAILMINISSEIERRSEGVLERFYAMVVFERLLTRKRDFASNPE